MAYFSREQVRRMGLEQLSESQLAEGVRALNDLAALFGKPWIERIFGGAQSTRLVLFVTSVWASWRLLKDLRGSATVRKRWSNGFHAQGVIPEILLAGALVRQNLTVELAPRVGRRVADLRFSVGSEWIYLEVAKRGVSREYERAQHALGRASEAAAAACPGFHGYVALLRTPSGAEEERIAEWLASGRSSEATQRLEDLAQFWTRPLSEPSNSSLVPDEVQKPVLFAASFRTTGGRLHARGTSFATVRDSGAKTLLQREDEQLPDDCPSVLALDVSSVVGGWKTWEQVIRQALSGPRSLRCSHVLLFSMSSAVNGLSLEGTLIPNARSLHKAPGAAVSAVERLIAK